MSDVISVSVDGQDYGGWKSVRITRGIEQLAGAFELTATDKWAAQNAERPILAGSSCTITLNGTTVITGFVDSVDVDRSDQDHSIRFAGRDRTGDLVDCVILNISQVVGLKLDAIAQRICKPFGIGVIVDTDVGDSWPQIALICGQKAFSALDQIARSRGVLLTSDGQGNLVLTQPGVAVAPVELNVGSNILRSRTHVDLRQRFSEYHIYTQAPGVGLDAPPNMSNEAVAFDAQIKALRFRPTGSQGDFALDPKFTQLRANWTRNVAAARSQTASYTVNGWAHSAGIWNPNVLVPVIDRDLQVKGQRLISQVTHTLDERSGTRTDIDTVGKHAFDRLAVPNDLLALAGGA